MARGKAAGEPSKPKQQPKKGPKPAKEAKPGDNSAGGITDEQSQQLLYSHDRKIARLEAAAQEAKKAVDLAKAALRADGFDMSDIKDIRAMRTDAGQKSAKTAIERRLRNFRWGGMPIGSQGNLFEEDRTPITERTFNDGRRIAHDGGDCKVPNSLPHNLHQNWIEGWHAGQADARANLERAMTRPRAEPISDEEFARQEPAGTA